MRDDTSVRIAILILSNTQHGLIQPRPQISLPIVVRYCKRTTSVIDSTTKSISEPPSRMVGRAVMLATSLTILHVSSGLVNIVYITVTALKGSHYDVHNIRMNELGSWKATYLNGSAVTPTTRF